jgi:hypothetical protein
VFPARFVQDRPGNHPVNTERRQHNSLATNANDATRGHRQMIGMGQETGDSWYTRTSGDAGRRR